MITFVKPQEILDFLKSDNTGFKNITSFRTKFLRNDNVILKITVHGKKIIDKLILENQKFNKNIKDKKNLVIKGKEKIQMEKSEEQKHKKTNLEHEKHYQKSDHEQDNEENKEEEDHEEIEDEENKDEEEEKDEEEDEKDEEDEEDEKEHDSEQENINESVDEEISNNAFIPIIIVPCNLFKFPKKNKEKYFSLHYKTCNLCDVTNNNNRELCSLIDKAFIEIFELEEDEHLYFDEALEYYFMAKKYEPADIKKLPFIRVIYINNGHDIYNKCLLVTWIEQ